MSAAVFLKRTVSIAMLVFITPSMQVYEQPAVIASLFPAVIEMAFVDTLIAPAPAPRIEKIWVKVRLPISIEELSSYLKLDKERLAKLNDVNEDHHFPPGAWLVVPSQQSRQIKQLAAKDTSELRRTPPLHSITQVEERAIVRFGDTVAKIAQRYGLTLQELLRLNPGFETARLVVGSPIRLAQSSATQTRMVLGLKPTTSGGINWPELPDPSPAASGANPQPAISITPAPVPLAQPSRPPTRWDASLDSLVRDGVVSPADRARIRSGSGMTPFNVPAHQQACHDGRLSPQECSSGVMVRWRGRLTISGPTIKPLSPNEQAVLQRIRSSSYTPKWRAASLCVV